MSRPNDLTPRTRIIIFRVLQVLMICVAFAIIGFGAMNIEFDHLSEFAKGMSASLLCLCSAVYLGIAMLAEREIRTVRKSQ